jgi:hypothetical protein
VGARSTKENKESQKEPGMGVCERKSWIPKKPGVGARSTKENNGYQKKTGRGGLRKKIMDCQEKTGRGSPVYEYTEKV